MKISHKISIILGSSFLAAFLGLILHIIQMILVDVSGRNMLGLSGLLYVFIPAFFFFWALILSIVGVHLDSLPLLISAGIIIALISAFGVIQSTIEIYQRPDYFDETFFKWNILQIISAFLIFPLISVLIWFVKKSFINANG